MTSRWNGNTGEAARSRFRRFSASTAPPTTAGPVKVVTLTSAGARAAPYALAAGTNTVGVNVALDGSFTCRARRNHPVEADRRKPVERGRLRRTRGGRVPRRDHQRLPDAVPAQRRPGICPDPSPPSGAADCVPTKTGAVAGPTLQGLDERFSTCPANNWPNYPLDDPRVIPLMITDFSALAEVARQTCRLRTSPRSTSPAGRARRAATTLRPLPT